MFASDPTGSALGGHLANALEPAGRNEWTPSETATRGPTWMECWRIDMCEWTGRSTAAIHQWLLCGDLYGDVGITRRYPDVLTKSKRSTKRTGSSARAIPYGRGVDELAPLVPLSVPWCHDDQRDQRSDARNDQTQDDNVHSAPAPVRSTICRRRFDSSAGSRTGIRACGQVEPLATGLKSRIREAAPAFLLRPQRCQQTQQESCR